MILGKRHRPPIKRTTSMTEFTLDDNHTATMIPPCNNKNNSHSHSHDDDPNNNPFNMNPPSDHDHRFFSATISPRNHRRNSADHMQTPHFMTVCRLCNRRLITGRDIFMYRGDSAFCSSECRQEQMKEDEKKEKQPLIPKKPVSECASNVSKID